MSRDAERWSARFDPATVVAVGMVAYLIKNVLHELVGHGGACVTVGCEPIAVSSAWFDGNTSSVSVWGIRWIKAAGTLANLVVAFTLLALWRRLQDWRQRWPRAGLFVWLLIVTNLLSGGGYMMVDPIGNFGDWSKFIEGLPSPTAWRFAIILVGLGLSVLALVFGVRTIEPFIGSGSDRKRRKWWICIGPYFVAGFVFPVSALLNPGGTVFVFTVALATLGGTAWLAWFLPFVVKRTSDDGPTALSLARSVPWLLAGVAAAAVTVFVLGPSIPL